MGGRHRIEDSIEGQVGLGGVCLDAVPMYPTVQFSLFGVQWESHWEPGIEVVILVGVLRWKQGKVKRARDLRMMFMKLLEYGVQAGLRKDSEETAGRLGESRG